MTAGIPGRAVEDQVLVVRTYGVEARAGRGKQGISRIMNLNAFFPVATLERLPGFTREWTTCPIVIPRFGAGENWMRRQVRTGRNHIAAELASQTMVSALIMALPLAVGRLARVKVEPRSCSSPSDGSISEIGHAQNQTSTGGRGSPNRLGAQRRLRFGSREN